MKVIKHSTICFILFYLFGFYPLTGVPNQTEKFYQVTIREMGPLWFDSLKLHVAESVMKKAEKDLAVFRKYLAKYHPIRKQFNNHFKNTLYKLAEGDSKTPLNKIIDMQTILVSVKMF